MQSKFYIESKRKMKILLSKTITGLKTPKREMDLKIKDLQLIDSVMVDIISKDVVFCMITTANRWHFPNPNGFGHESGPEFDEANHVLGISFDLKNGRKNLNESVDIFFNKEDDKKFGFEISKDRFIPYMERNKDQISIYLLSLDFCMKKPLFRAICDKRE